LSIFTSFLDEIKNSFRQVINIEEVTMPNNISSNFFALLGSHGILHQFTCPHTPQLNGIAKWKIDTWLKLLLLGANILVHH